MFSRSIVATIVLAAVCGCESTVASTESLSCQLTSFAAVNAQVPNCARNYTVVAGDTCDGISAKENVSSFQLASVNNATINADCTNLCPGEVNSL